MSKFTLADCQPQPYTFELVHPVKGESGATVTIMSSQSDAYQTELQTQREKIDMEKATESEVMEFVKHMAATAIIDWDESFFGQPFTTQAAHEALKPLANSWIATAIGEAIREDEHFFAKP